LNLLLAQTRAPLLEDAADAGARKPSGVIGENVRRRGFNDSDLLRLLTPRVLAEP
jgi:hypothetical protein